MLAGTKLIIGERELIVPPLTLKHLRTLGPRLKDLGEIKADALPTDEQFDLIGEVVHMALSRNYPDMTRDEVDGLLDIGNMFYMVNAVLAASGFERGAAKGAPGEA